MGRKKGLVSILLCGVMLSTAGCGTKPYDLSSEEQEKVAAYAAHVVTRYNDRQDEGLIKIRQEDLSEDTADSKTTQTDTKDKQETSGDSAKNTTAETEKPKAETVSLRQALKLEDGLDASFENYLLATGGSDFHGTNKPDIEIGTGRGPLFVPDHLIDDLMN